MEYAFDLKLFAIVRVNAATQAEARQILAGLLDCATVDLGEFPDGSRALAEASMDGEAELIEIDGEMT